MSAYLNGFQRYERGTPPSFHTKPFLVISTAPGSRPSARYISKKSKEKKTPNRRKMIGNVISRTKDTPHIIYSKIPGNCIRPPYWHLRIQLVINTQIAFFCERGQDVRCCPLLSLQDRLFPVLRGHRGNDVQPEYPGLRATKYFLYGVGLCPRDVDLEWFRFMGSIPVENRRRISRIKCMQIKNLRRV